MTAPARRLSVLSPHGAWWVVAAYIACAALGGGLFGAAVAWGVAGPRWRWVGLAAWGAVFLVASATLLYMMIRRLLRAQQQALERERAALQAQSRATGLLQALVDNSPDAIFAKDRRGNYLLFSAAAARFTGQDAGQVLGRDDRTLFPPEHAALVRANDERVMAQDRTQTFDETLDTAVGRVTFQAIKGPLHDAEGQVIGLFGISRDVTATMQAQQAMRHSELRYRLASASGHVWDWDLVGGRATLPVSFWSLLGHEAPAPDAVAARFEALLHPDDLPRWRSAVREHLVRREPYALEFRARHADGRWRWFQTQGQAVRGADGRATYMAGTTFDISARKEAEDALRQSEAYRRSLFEQLADGVLLLDRSGRVLDANPQALVMLGYRHDEMLRLSGGSLVAAFEVPRVEAEVQRVMTGQPYLVEWEMRRKDGSEFAAEVSARALGGERFLAVIRDISARRALQQAQMQFQFELSELAQQLMAQERATTRRIAQALHDHLGQTLAVARLNLDACLGIYAGSLPAPLREQGARIALLLDQAVREVRQVLSGLRPPLLEDRGLAATLDNELRARVVAGTRAELRLDVIDGAADVRWPDDVEYGAFMVAREAVANAVQHAGASLVLVRLGGDPGALSLDVVDDGRGIEPALLRGRPGHLGIVGMRERAIAIGARFAVAREPAAGTRVSLHWQAPAP